MRLFAHHLALRMGEVNVDRMLRKITMEQFIDWLAYVSISGPIDEIREDYRTASIRADINNALRRKNAAPKTLDKFLLQWGPKRKWSGWQHNKAMAYLIAGALTKK